MMTTEEWSRVPARDAIGLRIDGLSDDPRPGRPRTIEDSKVAEVIERTLATRPADATHWSLRSMAGETGLSHTTIWRIWGAFGLQPHRVETFKLSSDPHFVDKVRDIVGLYLSPPDRALVLCVDEKSQIQALDRSQPVLPMLPGAPERRTHDYKRNGTTSLFAALDVATGSVIGKCYRRHRAREFLDFLKLIDARVPDDLDIHIVMDNYATHKTAAVKAWLARRPHWHVHFTPTSASWINQVERWFAELTRKQLQRGVHTLTQPPSCPKGRGQLTIQQDQWITAPIGTEPMRRSTAKEITTMRVAGQAIQVVWYYPRSRRFVLQQRKPPPIPRTA